MSDTTYKLDELARAAGTSPRTVRYYVQRGLLPAPRFRGKDTAYDVEHLVRLRAIRRLSDLHLPLDAIAAELARRSTSEIARLADGKDLPRPLPVEYVDSNPREPPEVRTAAIDAVARTLWKLELAPGVELLVADDAPPESRRVVEKILQTLNPTSRLKEGNRT